MTTQEATRESAALVELRRELTARGIKMRARLHRRFGQAPYPSVFAVMVYSSTTCAVEIAESLEDAAFAAVAEYDRKVAGVAS